MSAVPRSPHRVVAVVSDGAPIFDVAVCCEVFGIDRRDLVDPWYEFRLCATRPGRVGLGGGANVDVNIRYGLRQLERAHTVIVTGTVRSADDAPERLLDGLRRAHSRGARLASICGGAYLLAAAGLLNGRQATTHWMQAADFSRRFPGIHLDPDVLYIDHGDVLTSAGTAAGIDLCLHLIRADHGAEVANEVARRMVIPPHRDGGQAQFVRLPLSPPGEDPLSAVLDWALAHLDDPIEVADLARRANLSARTFARRFRESTGTTPLQWLLSQRLRLAQQLLESGDDPIPIVARKAGFGTTANLRQHFTRATTVSPQAYRRAFRGEAEAS
jgi:transcriptional regulator GlxA family with amidase domain